MPDATSAAETPKSVLAFWREAGPKRWFKQEPHFDDALRSRFLETHWAASRGELDSWTNAAQGALALLLVLDQFPRNMFRGSAHAFATDGLAQNRARRAVDAGFDKALEPVLTPFFYMPFVHSERPADQARAVALFEALGDADTLKWARLHAELIERFGRFPHRNGVLGRQTTPEEQAYLDGGGFKG